MKAQNAYFSFSSCGSEESLASLHTQNIHSGNGAPGKNGEIMQIARPTTPRKQQQSN